MVKLRQTFIISKINSFKLDQKYMLIIIYFILVLSSVITCSYAFMLPVATAPNAIVYAASTMSTRDMASTGFAMNVICVLMTTLAINSYGVLMFNLNTFPLWANQFIPSSQNITCDNLNSTLIQNFTIIQG